MIYEEKNMPVIERISQSAVNSYLECSEMYRLSKQYKLFSIDFILGQIIHKIFEIISREYIYKDINKEDIIITEGIIKNIKLGLEELIIKHLNGIDNDTIITDKDVHGINFNTIQDIEFRNKLFEKLITVMTNKEILNKVFIKDKEIIDKLIDLKNNDIEHNIILGNEIYVEAPLNKIFNNWNIKELKNDIKTVGFVDHLRLINNHALIIDYKTHIRNYTIPEMDNINLQQLLYSILIEDILMSINYDSLGIEEIDEFEVDNINITLYVDYKKIMDDSIDTIAQNAKKYTKISYTKFKHPTREDYEKWSQNIKTVLLLDRLNLGAIGMSKYGCNNCRYKDKCKYYNAKNKGENNE